MNTYSGIEHRHNLATMPRKMDDVILAQSEPWEDSGRDRRAQETCTMFACAFGLLFIMAAVGWFAYYVIPWAWANLVWLWNAGPVDAPWMNPARWWIVTGAAMFVFCCIIKAWQWHRNRKRP